MKIDKRFLRLFFFRLLTLVGASAVLIVFFGKRDYDSRIDEIQGEKRAVIETQEKKLLSRFESAVSDVDLLSRFHELADSIYDFKKADPFHVKGLQVLGGSKPNYFQIRYIDSTGQERIRVEQYNYETWAADSSMLQHKGNRDYFKTTMELAPERIFISPLDLNVENEQVEVPFRPTIRFATPLFEEGNAIGILVINFDATEVINDLQESVHDKNTRLLFVQDSGYYLSHPTATKEWGGDIASRSAHNLKNDYPEVWAQIQENSAGSIVIPQGIFTFNTFILPKVTENGLFEYYSPVGSDRHTYYQWTIIAYTPKWFLKDIRNEILRNYGAFLLIVIIIGIVFSLESTSATIRKRNEEILKEERFTFVKQIIENLPHPLFFANEKHECQLSNRSFNTLIKSYQQQETFIGKNVRCNILGIDEKISYVFAHNETITFERQETHDGTSHDYFYKLAPVELASERGVVGIITDITELKTIERNLLKAQGELQEMNESKNKFFSIIAHDLKSPFNSILGFLDILEEEYEEMDEEERKEILRNIKHSSIKTFRLLQDILQWSRVQLGRMQIEPEEIELKNMAINMEELYQPSLAKKRIRLENNIREGSVLYADGYMVNTIFRNLISNAIKFTPEGGKITLEHEERPSEVVIRIKDNGVGIDEDKKKNLFRLDKNISSKGTSNETGTGLGLILVKEFTEKNDGTIEVNSIEGKGSTFTLRFRKKEQQTDLI